MAHCMKHTKASCGHMFAHFDRKAEHISNENVDRTRSHLNYNLAAHQQMEQGEFVRQRCSEVRCQNRKDVNVMVSWIVTAPKDLPQQAEPAFFQAAYDFLENRYGRSNVVSAYVHMDEVTPHMHFAFVPVTQDRKRGGYKVSAKEVITRRDLQTFHSDLSKYLEQQLGFPVNVLNEATKEGNRSIEQLKRQSATEQIAAAAAEAAQIVSKAREGAKVVEQDIQALEGKKTALEGEIEALEVKLQGRQLQIREVMEIKPEYEKGLFGSVKGIKGVTVSDIENLKATAIKGLEARDRLEKLTFEYERVKKLVPTMDKRMRDAQDKIRLEQLEKAFQRLPEHIQKQLLPAKNKSHDRGRER